MAASMEVPSDSTVERQPPMSQSAGETTSKVQPALPPYMPAWRRARYESKFNCLSKHVYCYFNSVKLLFSSMLLVGVFTPLRFWMYVCIYVRKNVCVCACSHYKVQLVFVISFSKEMLFVYICLFCVDTCICKYHVYAYLYK